MHIPVRITPILVAILLTVPGAVLAGPHSWMLYSRESLTMRGMAGIFDISPIDDCTPRLLRGTVESVEFRPRLEQLESFRLRAKDGTLTMIYFAPDIYDGISNAERGWFHQLVAPRRMVLVSIALCGAGGHIAMARDIIDARYVP